MTTDNFTKHTTTASLKQLKFLQRMLIDRFLDKVVMLLKPLPIQSILDVGAGEGFTLARLEREKIGTRCEGVEPLKTARELAKKINPSAKLIDGSAYSLPYKDNSFDLVLCSEVLEHLEDPQKALKELFRVSQKYVLISVPNEPWFMLGNFLRGKNLSRWGNDIEHINHWTASGFTTFVKQNTKLQRFACYHPLPWTIVLAQKK